MTIDIGTGDGRAILGRAAREPDSLVLGIDANAAAMVESSRRAARPARKGGMANARFILAAAEALPAVLAGRAYLVTVQFPWGSLLGGCVGLDSAIAAGVAALVAPAGELELPLAPSARDRLAGAPADPDELRAVVAETFAGQGLELVVGRPASQADVAASGSTWARRLGSNPTTDRSVVLVRFQRAGSPQSTGMAP